MSTKIDATERLLNLVIALLGTRRGYSKSYLRARINGYTSAASTSAEEEKVQASFERMFERDKKTLQELGIPMSVTTSYDTDAQDQSLYRIDPVDYRVPEVRLDESAMTLLAVAANLWAEATFGAAAQSALRKIATRAGTSWYEDSATTQSRIRTTDPSFEPLWTALRNHHPVSFGYNAAGASSSTQRNVQPWGLGNKYGQWYLSGFDLDKGEQRNFRLSRITTEVNVNAKDTFTRPAEFTIASVLERLGTGTEHTAQIAVPLDSAHWLRSRPGTTLATDSSWHRDQWEVLSVRYREPELMADDVASMGAHALVVAPPALRESVAGRLHRAANAAAAEVGDLDWNTPMPGPAAKKKDSRDRLIRLLSMVPYLVANPGVDEAEVLAEFSISAAEWARDRDTLNVSGRPGYLHGDLMDVTTEAGHVFIRDAETLASPLRLTQEEACSVLVGLQALTALPGTEQAKTLNAAIESLSEVAGEEAWLADAVGLQLISGPEVETIATLQNAILNKRACTMTYLVRTRDELGVRMVEPVRLFSVDALWYLRAWCLKAGELRSFRVDHIKELSDAGAQEHTRATELPWQPSTGVYDPGSEDHQVQLVAAAAAVQRLGPAYNASLFELPHGEVGLRLLVGDTATLAPLMARLGGQVRVVGPSAVRAETVDWLARASASYDAVGENTPALPSMDG
ncbi:helix-turn-helix transcriptional regulator [Arthrobacter sp. TMN-49]